MSDVKDQEDPPKDRADGPGKTAAAKTVAAKANEAAVEVRGERSWVEYVTENAWIGLVLMVPAAFVVGFIQGAPAAMLVLIAAALITVIALFWSSVRTLLGETPLSGADAYAIAAPRAEEEQKQAVLRALKDLEFERSVGKISEEDYAVLVTRYRAEAKRLLRVIDEEAKPRRDRVEHLVRKRLVEAGLAPPLEPSADTSRSPAPATDEKKKKKKRKGEAAADAPGEAAVREAEPAEPERRVEIEPAEPEPRAEAKKGGDRGKPSIDVTWKSPLPTKTQESAAYVPPTKKCAECGTRNDPDANFCKKCGSKAFERGKAKVAVTAQGAEPAGAEAPGGEAAAAEKSTDTADQNTASAANDEADSPDAASDAPAGDTAR